MALTKKIILFILSIIFTILLLAATTSFSADKFSRETLESNSRIYTMEWTSIDNEDNKIFVCGAKLSTFDFSGRKYIFEYYLILLDNDNIVARFEVKAIQLSINNIDPPETESLEMKVYGAKITRENKDLFGAPRDSNPKGKFLGVEYEGNMNCDAKEVYEDLRTQIVLWALHFRGFLEIDEERSIRISRN